MPSVLIVTKEVETSRKLQGELSKWGFVCQVAGATDRILDRIVREGPEMIILELDGQPYQDILKELTTAAGRVKRKSHLMAIIDPNSLSDVTNFSTIEDFVLKPCNERELAVRARRLLQKDTKKEEVLRCDDLVIDLANCEVRVAGRIVELTYKEYELLKFLAKDRGRVFTRETLLNQVWGYDYFGGDRTVDVHVRRLRSKIELSDQSYIETVRNIGYRFKKGK